jgi:tyrosyl-tRNA synthetase
VVRRKQAPAEIETAALPDGVLKDGAIRVDKLLARIGLAESVSDAARKVKAGAVEINGGKWTALAWTDPTRELLIQVGKNWRKVIR